MKRLFFLFMLCSSLVSFDKSAPKVLIFIKDGSPQFEYMLTNEVGKMSEVNIDEYAGFILPCMVVDLVSSEVITFFKKVADKCKTIAAQAGSVALLAKTGILNGKKYALNIDVSKTPDFKNGIYSGKGVIQDGIIITSGTCPWLAKETGNKDGTSELTQTLIKVIKVKTK